MLQGTVHGEQVGGVVRLHDLTQRQHHHNMAEAAGLQLTSCAVQQVGLQAYICSQWCLRYSVAAPQKKAKRPASSLRP